MDYVNIGLVLVGWLIALAVQWGIDRRRWNEVDKVEQQFRKSHDDHYRSDSELKSEVAGLKQTIEDHIVRDDERFEESREMLKEIRQDIKESRQDMKQVLRTIGGKQ